MMRRFEFTNISPKANSKLFVLVYVKGVAVAPSPRTQSHFFEVEGYTHADPRGGGDLAKHVYYDVELYNTGRYHVSNRFLAANR